MVTAAIAAVAVPVAILVTWLILVLLRKGVPDRMLHWQIPGRVDGQQDLAESDKTMTIMGTKRTVVISGNREVTIPVIGHGVWRINGIPMAEWIETHHE